MATEIDDLIKRRRDAVEDFMEANESIMVAQHSEIERIRDDYECEVSEGPFLITRWILVIESQSLSNPDEGMVNVIRKFGTTYTDQVGLISRAMDL